jgi:hypothetical protein
MRGLAQAAHTLGPVADDGVAERLPLHPGQAGSLRTREAFQASRLVLQSVQQPLKKRLAALPSRCSCTRMA